MLGSCLCTGSLKALHPTGDRVWVKYETLMYPSWWAMLSVSNQQNNTELLSGTGHWWLSFLFQCSKMKICVSLSVKPSLLIQSQIFLSDTNCTTKVLQTLCFSKPVFGSDVTIFPPFFNYSLSWAFKKKVLLDYMLIVLTVNAKLFFSAFSHQRAASPPYLFARMHKQFI